MPLGEQPVFLAPAAKTADAPANPSKGQIYFDIDTPGFLGWDGSAWIALDGGGGGGGGAPTGASYVVIGLNASLSNERTLAVEASRLSLTDGGSNGAVTIGIATNGVTNGKFRQSVALSVVGNATNATDNVDDIVASAADQILRVNSTGTALGWGTLRTAGIQDAAVTYAKIQDTSAAEVLIGRGQGAGAGDVQELTLGSGLALTGTVLSLDTSILNAQYILAAAEPTLPNSLEFTAGTNLSITSGAGLLTLNVFLSATQRLVGRNTAGAGVSENLSISTVLDWITNTQGSLLVRDAASWSSISPSATAGLVLTSNGTGALPTYQTAKITTRKNSGADVGTRQRLNFIEGSNITLTVTDDVANNEVDITIAASGGGSGLTHGQVMSRVFLG